MLAVSHRPSGHRKIRRRGFTLIEVLTVVVVITILIALLLPALSGVRKRTRIAQVRTEISTLEAAIAQFKADFGVEPPGSIRLFNSAAGWNTVGASPAAEAIRVQSRAYLRQVWPQFDFNAVYSSQPGGANLGTSFVDLNGAECLVFFLGGVSSPSSGTTLVGFSKSATSPFAQTGSSRIQPYFTFVPNRLCDKDGDGMYEYLDPIPSQASPYLYFSSNGGQGYSTALNPPFSSSPTDWCNTDCYLDGWQNNATWGTSANWQGNWMKYAYYSTFSSTGTVSTDISASVPFLPQKYQIISPGFGGVGAATPAMAYGSGGLFDPANPSSLSGTPDGDNITNLAGGTLSGE